MRYILMLNMPEYRRKLHHFHPGHACLFMTWRLAGSVPGKTGPLWLTDSRIADLVADRDVSSDRLRRMRHYNEGHCVGGLIWLADSARVHMLIFQKFGAGCADPHEELKGSTARHANQILGRTGHRFWQDESFDHYLRRSDEVWKFATYIDNNPVAAGLTACADDWRWSSAGWKDWQAEPPAPPEVLAGEARK